MKKLSVLLSVFLAALTLCACGKDILSQAAIEKKLAAIIADAVISEINLVQDGENSYYEGSMSNDRAQYDFKLDAYSGKTISWKKTAFDAANTDTDTVSDTDTQTPINSDTDSSSEEIINRNAVTNILNSNFPTIRVINELELNDDLVPPTYTGTFTTENSSYKFEINALTGEIVNYNEIPMISAG